MNPVYKRNRAFFGEPYILTPEQQKDPISVFHSFFDSLHLEEARGCLEELRDCALTSTMTEFSKPQERENAIYLCMQLEQVLEAAWIIKTYSHATKLGCLFFEKQVD